MEQLKIKWLEGGGCVIDGKVWVNVISPVHTPGLGYAIYPMYFDSEKHYYDTVQKRSQPNLGGNK